MNIEDFYKKAEWGERTDIEEFRQYVNGYRNVIMWGCGNLGKALGRVLTEKGMKLTAYWDAKADEMKEHEGIPVLESFTGDFKPEETLVIVGIVNGTLSDKWQKTQLESRGFVHYLYGMKVYEGIACPMLRGEKLDVQRCTSTNICNFNTCKKYMNLMEQSSDEKEDFIAIQVLNVQVTSRCTLDCIHCGQQTGVTKRKFPEKYKDYPLDRVKRDVDLVTANVDVIGAVSLIGGEPLLYPHIAEVIKHCLSKENIAIISITTNGVCNISSEVIECMKNPRIKLNFSNYTASLGERERHIFYENLKKVRAAGIPCNDATPIWSACSDDLVLRENPDFSAEFLSKRKKYCQENHKMESTVAEGIFFPCATMEYYDRNEKVDVRKDTVNLYQEENLRERIAALLNQDYYEACGYRCANGIAMPQVVPGEQRRD